MNTDCHALISLEARFAEGILSGIKQVELRRRPMRLSIGTIVWMYVKVPVGEVIGSAQVHSLHALPPATLWRKYANVSGLTKEEFFDYYSGVERGFVLELKNPSRLPRPVSLGRLRSLEGGFQPPQFFRHLASDGALVTALTSDEPASRVDRSCRVKELRAACVGMAL